MKYVVTWEVPADFSQETGDQAREAFGRWSPAEGSNFLQFLGRLDGRGGFAVVETEDPTSVLRDVAVFSTFFDMNVYPVTDASEVVQIFGEAAEFLRSAG
jgi:hypothetical protein